MKLAFAILLAAHGLVHLLGFAKAFGLAELEQLRRAIGRGYGLLWLAAALGFVAAAVLLFLKPTGWWVAALPALVASQVAIVGSWREARFGTIPNVVATVPLVLTLASLGTTSFASSYAAEVQARLAAGTADEGPVVTEADLAALPPPIRTYLRRAGTVGRPRVRDVEARFTGEMHPDPTAPARSVAAEIVQHDFFGGEPARVFLMTGARFGLPFEAYHLFRGPTATMQVRVASLFSAVDARGPEMDQSETVTFFNDMCILAPASLLDAQVQWRVLDPRSVAATFSHAGHTIRAQLLFDGQGDLVGFESDDRFQSADGKTYRKYRWSTPVGDYRDFGGRRLAARAEAIWLQPDGPFVYARFALHAVRYNVGARAEPQDAPARLSRGAGR